MVFILKKSFILLFSLMAMTVQAQTVIKGKVVDINDLPLVGASVSVKGTTLGTVTDTDGKFILKSPKTLKTTDKIVFSYLGYETEIVSYHGKNTEWIIRLNEKNVALNDVVVTALGIKRNERGLGYSTSKLDGNEVMCAVSSNWSQGLVGKVAGLSINSSGGPLGSTRIALRGDVSLNQGGNNALIVVDGVPMSAPMINTGNAQSASGEASIDFGNGFSDLNPEDIESIQILKGASATALYAFILTTAAFGAKRLTAFRFFRIFANTIRCRGLSWLVENLENLKLTQVLSTQFIYNQFITIFTPLIKEQHRNKTID